LPGNISTALEAGIVSRWLTNYPFPCAVDKNRKEDVVILMKAWWSDDEIMSNIFEALYRDAEGKRQLRQHGLMASVMEEDEDDGEQDDEHDDEADDEHDDEDDHEHEYDHNSYDDHDEAADGDVWMVDGEDTAGPIRHISSRVRFSAADQALRRRRREAMVLSEGGRPLGHEDIIQRPIQDD
jgi:hypothetical protein